MSEPLRIGMLGYRFMGRAHTNALDRLRMFFPDAPRIERDVLIGRDERALERAADRLGFTRTQTDWQQTVADIDVLYNLGPNHLHAGPSIAALEADTHVFCEKPLARTLEEAARMREAAEASAATAAIGFNYRFLPAVQYARDLIAGGTLGEIHHVRARYLQDWLVDPNEPWSWRNDEDLAGSGALGDLGSHALDLIRFLVESNAGTITDVSGHLRTFVSERPAPDDEGTREVTVDDAVTGQIQFENDALGTLEASRVATGSKNALTIEIDGSSGSLRFGLERMNELELLEEGDRGYQTVLVTEDVDPYVEAWWPPGHVLGWEHSFVHENYEFLTAIAGGRQHSPGFGDGYRIQELLDGIERADATQAWVAVGPSGK